MHNVSKVEFNPRLNTRVMRISYPDARGFLTEPLHQKMMRDVYEDPGIVIIDNLLEEDVLETLRLGLSDKSRKFKDKFNEGVERSGPVATALAKATSQILQVTKDLFGYTLPEKIDSSFRPMISANEPIHFDSYHVDCGLTPLMSTFNFDRGDHLWKVGPNFAEMCAVKKPEVEEALKDLPPGIPASLPLRVTATKGHGPLSDPDWIHKIAFAPNALWYANPKIIAHELVYGRGAIFNTWWIDQPACKCQKCLLEQAGINVGTAVTVDA